MWPGHDEALRASIGGRAWNPFALFRVVDGMDKLTSFLERRSLREVALMAVSAGGAALALALTLGNPLALI